MYSMLSMINNLNVEHSLNRIITKDRIDFHHDEISYLNV